MSAPFAAGLQTSNYILNIVELQNTVNSITGLSPLGSLSNTVAQLAQMVRFDTKTIATNVLSNFDGSTIQVVAPLVGSGAGGGLGATTISSIGTGTAGTLEVGGSTFGLQFTQSTLSTFVMTNAGDAVFSGTVYAQNFLVPSDAKWKQNVRPIVEYETILGNVQGVRFEWSDSRTMDVGLLAQQLERVLPEAVVEGVDGLRVSYMKLVPVLVEAVKNLTARVRQLEGTVAASLSAASLSAAALSAQG